MRALLLLLVLTSCAPPLTLEGATCPCTTGWTCCENVFICVREGASCPTVPGPDVSPASVELGQDRIQRFTTTATDVTWAIEEGAAGGTIDQTGRYRASNVVGEYHVLATARGGTTRVPVTVRPLRLSVLAGAPGGPSKVPVDGVGQLARISQPGEIAHVQNQLYFADAQRLRRVDLTTRRVDTVIKADQRRIPNPPLGRSERFSSLTVGRADTLLFIDDGCARELSIPLDAMTTFWCDKALRLVAGDDTRLVRMGGFPYRLVVVDRASQHEVELPPPAEGWVWPSGLSLEGQNLWVLDHNGTAVRVYDLSQPTAAPVTVVEPTAGRLFKHLEGTRASSVTDLPAVALLDSSGTIITMSVLGRELRRSPQVYGLSFTGGTEAEFFVLTADTIRRAFLGSQELLVGRPASGRLEIDGIGGGAGLALSMPLRFAIRGDVTWVGSQQSIRRIARDGTTTSIPSDVANSIAVDDRHVYLFCEWKNELQRIAIGGGAWQLLPYQPNGTVRFLGTMNDGRIAFLENRTLKFLDPTTGDLRSEQIAFPNLAAHTLTLDPAGAVLGEVAPDQAAIMPTTLTGVLRFDLETRRLTQVAPAPLAAKAGSGWETLTFFATGTRERQYALSNDGDQVFVNDGLTWVPLVGESTMSVVVPGPLPARVNEVMGVATLDNGDLVLFDTAENVVLVVE